ncbi:uncharacterized protein MELLADRAFT_109022 [Melampsora larici-populina 98AG31]|uniref:Uncharacterized protein n=1 Tax=Melampsora larici-populina (strain 98AG31 / pathotype 3-4-7) TaxID=747676 RepID=F4RV25_MELLP|nr:uncharacterized protein MELLADRAFT_109022 [Melampsora larici-populina 98AG31]EGG03828.1 hypothetical protein MELLADRAFT_109022 [Melampsora larici-populina 98AG31]
MALKFINEQHHASNNNMSDIITGTFDETFSHNICCPNPALDKGPNLEMILTCPPKDQIRSMIIMKELVSQLMSDFNTLYSKECEEYEMELDCEDIFDKEKHAWPITKNADIISRGVSLRGIFGSKAMDAAELDGQPPSHPKNPPAPPQNDADNDCEVSNGNISGAPIISLAPQQFNTNIDPRLTSDTNG